MPRLFSYHFSLRFRFAVDKESGKVVLIHRFRPDGATAFIPIGRLLPCFCRRCSAPTHAVDWELSLICSQGKRPRGRAATCRYFVLISVGEDARNPIVAYGAPAISGSLAASHCAGADAGLGDAITGFTLFGAGQDASSFVHTGSRSLVSMSNS